MMDDNEAEKRRQRGFKPNVQMNGKRKGARSFIMTPEGAFIQKDGKLHTLADAVDLFCSEVAHDPASWNANMKGYQYLVSHTDTADREDVRRALGWLEMALAQRQRDAAVAACKYLAAIPPMLLAADYGRVMAIFNSRIVGMVWALTPDLDMKPLPPRIPRFGQEAGFGLIRAVPEFYAMLAMLGPEMEEIVTQLVEEALAYKVSLPPQLVSLARSGPAARG
ncbi:hypothetical protein [Aurantiacibacter rhizosphaerae]|uniref:Uncharacterized protein n=1 Tax=Aurantiacibacter rhizosphaerae TaxID=2691582 RepID=A0A844XA82_9SPHN|nr:hypothetical protein [Aurantiacibacter rhizosphaerae]MWV26574.1 hypothetical protein [Aurantiacibacter rhizosphaerae]